MMFWHRAPWDHLTALYDQGRLPPALLFSGLKGLGKQNFALRFGQWALCPDKNNTGPCGVCQSCRWMQASIHPAWLCLTEHTMNSIRELKEALVLQSQHAKKTWIVITDAEKLGIAASNALLKTIEEGTDHTQFILLSSAPTRMALTLRSRLIRVAFQAPMPEQSQKAYPELSTWALRMAQGAPLAALAWQNHAALRTEYLADLERIGSGQGDYIKIAEKWAQEEELGLYLLYYWLIDRLLCAEGISSNHWVNADYQGVLSNGSIESTRLHALLTQIEQRWIVRSMVGTVNKSLFFEKIFSQYRFKEDG